MLVTYEHVTRLTSEAKISPEEMGQRLGISGMTIRRWAVGSDPKEALPRAYLPAFIDVTYQLIAEGKISAQAPLPLEIVQSARPAQIEAAFHALGLSPASQNPIEKGPAALMESLSQIGSNQDRRQEVLRSTNRISVFAEYGREWKERTGLLLKAIRSK